jgi:hypothetical protein
MAPLAEDSELASITDALTYPEAYVDWKPVPLEWVRDNLEGQTRRSIQLAMLDHLKNGGTVNRKPETRPEYRNRFEWFFEFKLVIDGQRIYIEATLDESLITPLLRIVSLHEDRS